MEFENNINGPNGTNFISPSVMRYISLQGADQGEKIALAYKNGKVVGQPVTRDDSTNDKWRMIQGKSGLTSFFYFYHCETGLCLARDSKGGLVLTDQENLQTVDLHNNPSPVPADFYGLWQMRGNERGIYVLAPDVKKPDWTPDTYLDQCVGVKAKDEKRQIMQGAANPNNWFGAIYPGDPIGGNVYILLGAKGDDGDYPLSTGPPADDDAIKAMNCVGVVQTGDKSHAWYMLEQLNILNEVLNIPVRSGMSLGEFFSWDPKTDTNAQYNICREKLAPRFIDKSTQIMPDQSEFPRICAITQNPNAVDCFTQYTSQEMFNRITTFNWQYVDIYAYFGGDQGYCPDEFKNISIENMGLTGNFKNIGPGPLSNPDAQGKYQPNTANLYTYLDGKRSAGLGGRVTIPPKWMVDACHKNGVKCYGSIFFQEVYYGGKWGWWVQFCQDPELSAKRMADICDYYGFDGWLFNLETGPPDAKMPREYAGQVYSGINQLTGEPADEYWCNVISAAKYPTWWVNQGDGLWQDDECGSAANWPCSCLPQNVNADTLKQTCGTAADGYTGGCNNGWLLRENFKKMIKIFNQYRKDNNIQAELFLYDTIQVTSPLGVGISTVDPTNCPEGINNTGWPSDNNCYDSKACYGNFDFWQDEDGPVADYLFSMRSGCGGSEPSASPQGATSTYIVSQTKEKFHPPPEVPPIRRRENYTLDYASESSPDSDTFWPLNTGPGAAGTFCPAADENSRNLFYGQRCNFGKPTGLGNIPPDRALDYYQALQMEGLGPGIDGGLQEKYSLESVARALQEMTASGNPQGWDSAIYCGTQSKNLARLGYGGANGGNCVNEETAINPPISSLNLYYIDTAWRWFDKYSNVAGFPNKQAITDWVVQNQLVFWTGARLLNAQNRITTGTSAGYWKGLSHYVSEKSCIQSYPFYTSFSLGAGKDFWIKGQRQDFGDWNNWSLQSVLPTWMWCPRDEDLEDARFIKLSFDVSTVFQGSNSLAITTVPDPGSWLRTSPGACNTNLPKEDCKIPDKGQCLAAGCCFDDTKNPWCFHKNDSERPGYSEGAKNATYKLFKTNLSLQKGCFLSLTTKITGGNLSVGYSLQSDPLNPKWISVPSRRFWSTILYKIPSGQSNLVIIWIKVSLPFDFNSTVYIGELCLTDHKSVWQGDFGPTVKQKYTTSSTKSMSCVLQWSPVDCVYYNIFQNDKLIGHMYQGRNVREKTKKLPISFSVISAPPGAKFRIKPSQEYGPFLTMPFKISGGALLATFIVLLWTAITAITVVFWKKLATPWRVGLISGVILIPLTALVVSTAARKGRPVENHSVEMWQNCKSHAFNACFDDSRVKCWHWLIFMWKKKKWPIKFSFFYNTLWISRDYYILKDWIALGHEVCGHMHDHMCACATQQVTAYNSDGTKTWGDFTDQNLADNLILCAKLIRELYGQPDRELIMAWPHGSFPLLSECDKTQSSCGDGERPCGYPDEQDCGSPNPHDGKSRPKAITALEKYYIAARSTMLLNYNTWPNPAIIPPDTPDGTWNQDPIWPYDLDPKWGWPYPVEIDPPSVTDPKGICQGYLDQMRSAVSLPYGVIILAGHSFTPTDAEGNDVPCDWNTAEQMTDGPYDGSWCRDKNDCQNTFVCPEEIRDITKACWTNPPGTPMPLYKKGNSGELSDPTFPPSKDLGLQPPTSPECDQCCDAPCWNPVPGSCLIKLFDEVSQKQDIFWFATFTEIVQYTYNRQNSKLYSAGNNNFILECQKMYQCDLTLSFGSQKFSAKVDGKSTGVFLDRKSGKYYIKFTPKSNTKHKIAVSL